MQNNSPKEQQQPGKGHYTDPLCWLPLAHGLYRIKPTYLPPHLIPNRTSQQHYLHLPTPGSLYSTGTHSRQGHSTASSPKQQEFSLGTEATCFRGSRLRCSGALLRVPFVRTFPPSYGSYGSSPLDNDGVCKAPSNLTPTSSPLNVQNAPLSRRCPANSAT